MARGGAAGTQADHGFRRRTCARCSGC